MTKILTVFAPEDLAAYAEKKALAAFRRAAERVPAYRQLLARCGVSAIQVQTMEDFLRLVPIIGKEDVFAENGLAPLCVDGCFGLPAVITASSGSSGSFAFGLSDQREEEAAKQAADDLLDLIFQTSEKRTFLINALPMGVTVPASLPQAAVGPRADTVVALLKKLRGLFDQFIIVGDPHFLKKAVEDGAVAGVDWKNLRVHLVTGGDWPAEGLRTYLAKLLGHDFKRPENGQILTTMGLTELCTNLLQESAATVRIRRAAETNPRLRAALFGPDAKVAPLLFHHWPHKTFVETADRDGSGWGELVFTALDSRRQLPLIRYRTGDRGRLIPWRRLKAILHEHGLGDLTPEWRLPLVAVQGRVGRNVAVNGRTTTPEEVRAGLYASWAVAAATTGQFGMEADGQALRVAVRLREGRQATPELTAAAERHIAEATGLPTEVTWLAFPDEPGFAPDYERKFNHLWKTQTPRPCPRS